MTPDDVMALYRMGCFPMASGRDQPGFDVVAPYARALLPVHHLHIPRRLRRTIKACPFDMRTDTAFADVVRGCALAREESWINSDIEFLYRGLYEAGHAHSVECWHEGLLVGGLYGVSLGRVFCGESMFSRRRDASKVALVALCARLSELGYQILDAQFRNPHLDQFCLYEISQEDYVGLLQKWGDETSPGFGACGTMSYESLYAYMAGLDNV